MRMNHRRTILLSAILFSVSAVADPRLPGMPADYPTAAQPDHTAARQSDREMPDTALPSAIQIADTPLQLRAETSLQEAVRATMPQDDSSPHAVRAGWTQDGGAQSHDPLEGKLQQWVAVAPHVLDDLRGGFDTSLRLTLSFGIERAVYLNGALVTTTSFNLPAMHGAGVEESVAMPGSTDAMTAMPSSTVALIQNGPNNHVSSASTLPLASTVIQNTLNNQTIQNITTINASANSLQLLRANAFQNLLRDGISHGIGGH